MMSPILERVGSAAGGQLEPHKIAELLHIPLEGVAALARAHRNTVSRTPGSHHVQAGLSVVIRILIKAGQIMGGEASVDRAVLWFKNQPLSGFGSKTAMDLVREGKADAVFEHLEMLEDGVYA